MATANVHGRLMEFLLLIKMANYISLFLKINEKTDCTYDRVVKTIWVDLEKTSHHGRIPAGIQQARQRFEFNFHLIRFRRFVIQSAFLQF